MRRPRDLRDLCIYFPKGQYSGKYKVRYRHHTTKNLLEVGAMMSDLWRVWIQDPRLPATKAEAVGPMKIQKKFLEDRGR